MLKKLFVYFFAAAMIVTSLAGCKSTTEEDVSKSQKTEEKEESSAENEDLDNVSVVLDWYPNAVHGFMYVAEEKGFYKEEGINLDIKFPSNPNDAIALTAAGKADLGVYYLQDIIMAKVNENIPVKAVGTIVQSPLSIVLSLKEKNILSPNDFKGKTLGYGGTVLSEAIIRTMIKNTGGNENDVNVLDVGFDLMSSMTTGNVDATIGCLINHEVPAMEEEGFELNYFFPSEYGVPDYYELVFVTGDEELKNDSDKIKRFLRASKKGFDYMKQHPDEALEILLKNQNEENFPLSESVEKKSFDYLIPEMEKENAEFLFQDIDVWQNNADWLYDEGLLKEKIDANEIVENLDIK